MKMNTLLKKIILVLVFVFVATACHNNVDRYGEGGQRNTDRENQNMKIWAFKQLIDLETQKVQPTPSLQQKIELAKAEGLPSAELEKELAEMLVKKN